MGGEDSLGVTTGQPNLYKQDLSKLDVSKLTPLSEEVISRQATINIGTIGHVAHGKSTIVKAISGVQTVRFKNELERNITIKLETHDVDTGNEEMAVVPANDDPNKLLKFCEKRSCDTSEDSTPPSKRSKSSSTPEKAYCKPSDRQINLSASSSAPGYMKLREVRVCISPMKKPNETSHNSTITEPDTYEVEKILGKKIKDNQVYYLIKWKGWSASHNTWEPQNNLSECVDLVNDFEDSRAQLLERFKADEKYFPAVEHLERLMAMKLKCKESINISNSNDESMYANLKAVYSQSSSKNIQKLKDQIKKQILQSMFWTLRRDQLDSLHDWEAEINNITHGRPKIQIVNNIDFESAPQDFFYIEDYLPGSGVIIPDEPPIGCECKECSSKTKCCYAQCDGSFPYTRAGRVRIPPGTPIYECNKRCRCSTKCKNRVVQSGSNVDLCIFRTSNGRGWGVKTISAIKKGTFITQYVGEVITSEEAEKRGKEYDAAGRTYLFDLDYNEVDEQSCPYTVDAAMYGNISHFINHSCDPNSAVYAVWIDCLDPNLPKLALFATRDIIANEEITFNYMRESPKALEKKNMNSPKKAEGESDTARQRLELPGDRGQSGVSGKTRCKCGAKCCRQWLF